MAAQTLDGDSSSVWPEAIVFIQERVPQGPAPPQGDVQFFRFPGAFSNSRAYFEMDLLGPALCGRALYLLKPARPDGKAQLLHRAGQGLIGSPSVSYDGKEVFFSMVAEGEKLFHIYAIPVNGGNPRALTSGPFHDFDPEPLPDGRLVFSSTRLGTREEYHGNPARCLFVMNRDGSGIRPITMHIVGDTEPRVTASGQIAFIRHDNFMERAKVETHIHSIRPDGTAPNIFLGVERAALGFDRATAAETDGQWLRQVGFGSPAPLPDGRVAALSSYGLVISGAEPQPAAITDIPTNLVDIAPLPDGRLLCSMNKPDALGILDLTNKTVTTILNTMPEVHSAVYAGARTKPKLPVAGVDPKQIATPEATGFLVGENFFLSRQTNAELWRVKAIRVVEGKPFATRSARHQYNHIGVEAVELGTAPLAPDGSFFLEVPADRALSLQGVDGEGRTVINEVSWIYVRPGEQRSCVGCHYQQKSAPSNSRELMALRARPIPLLGKGNPVRFRGNNGANGGMLNLQYDRFREVSSFDGHDAKQSTSGSADEVATLLRTLESGDPSAQISAAQRLAVFRDRSAAPGLATALKKSSDSSVRMNAALALASCGTRDSVECLRAVLTARDAAVAQAASLALNHLNGQQIDFNAYGSRDDRERGIEAWRSFFVLNSWERIEQRLIEQLELGDPSNEQKIVTALGHIGGDLARAALEKYVRCDTGKNLRATLEAVRALGHLKALSATSLLSALLKEQIENVSKPKIAEPGQSHEFGWQQRPVHLAGAAAEALGRIGTAEAEDALLKGYGALSSIEIYNYAGGEHEWLVGCGGSIPHYRIAEALDRIKSTNTAAFVGKLIQSLPNDTDRAVLFENDSFETVIGRVVQRSGRGKDVVETCLHVLGDTNSVPALDLIGPVTISPPALSTGALDRDARAAQVLSAACFSADYATRIVSAFDRYRAKAPSRARSWTCFYLARTLGKLRHPDSIPSLRSALEKDATEASFGLAEPPNVFLNNAMTPCYRAAAAYSLGQIGDPKTAKVLLNVIANFDNAMDVRNAAAQALSKLNPSDILPEIQKLAETYPEVVTRRMLLDISSGLKK